MAGSSELDNELQTEVNRREAIKEKAFRDERNRLDEEFRSNIGMGGTEMSPKELRKIVDADRRIYYRTEELNDKLYIHYKGWRELKSLEGWTGLKTLYGECNAFSQISGLQNCTMLRSLFLQENCINKISGLENCHALWSLNLANNFIERIEGLENLKGLNTLIVSRNKIGFGGIADIEKLVDTNIGTLDLQDNRIDDPDVVPEVFNRMQSLRVLYMKGNPAAKKIVNYRKSLTVYCWDLRYLDDRPIFEDDRRCAEAFNRGGLEEQRAEQKRIREEKTEKHERNMRLFSEMVENSRREKRERDAMRIEDKFTDETDPVESQERRCKRLQDQWKEDNKEDIKDHERERAERILAAEREGGEAAQEAKATIESRDTAAESGDTGDVPPPLGNGKAVDNRKLVYEDIWDESPAQPPKADANGKEVFDEIWDKVRDAAKEAREAEAAKPSVAQSSFPLASPTSLGPAVAKPAVDEGVFMPWADGAVGMDALEPSKEVLDRRRANLNAKSPDTAKRAEEEASAAGKPTWHSKYLEQVSKSQAQTEASMPKTHIFAPAPRKSEAAAAAPEPAGPDASAALAGGELDEMD